MECLRFGGTIPGEYWGCCAVDIFQNFKQDPDTPASIQLVHGDGGGALTEGSEGAYLGPTLRDIFWQRLRISTMGKSDMPNHGFLAILEHSQIQHPPGSKWLAILKEAGFEFIRTVDNSVYTGPGLGGSGSPHPNYIFGLFRNIGGGKVSDPFTPPKQWTDLDKVVPEAVDFIPTDQRKAFADEQRELHTAIWKAHGPTKILKESEVKKAGAPVIMAGMRTQFPPMLKEKREQMLQQQKEGKLTFAASSGTQHLYTYLPSK